jgi:hypothetical protein
MKTPQERAQDRRREKLAAIDEQVRSGSLVVRQMTEEERARYPPRAARPRAADRISSKSPTR